jgi:2-hydroxy-3-oxopropionate reductase
VGGDQQALETARQVLESFAASIVHIGSVGAGEVAKACNQLVVASTIEAVAEAFALARACGVDPGKVREAMLGGFAASRVLEYHGMRMLMRDFSPGARLDLHAKDAHIILSEAESHGLELPGFTPVAHAIDRLVEAGYGGLDHSALVTLLPDSDGGTVDATVSDH